MFARKQDANLPIHAQNRVLFKQFLQADAMGLCQKETTRNSEQSCNQQVPEVIVFPNAR